MKNILNKLMFGLSVAILAACSPIDENLIDGSHIETNATYAEGILMNGYNGLDSQFDFTCEATDDAVNNKIGNSLSEMAKGRLSAQFNPLSQWYKYESILYLNKFLSIVDNVIWRKDVKENELYIRRMKGEALALRGLMHFYLLQAHAGIDGSGKLMGIPYYTSFIEKDGNFYVPRSSFEECVSAIEKDFNDAYELLPYIYSDNAADIQEKDKIYDEKLYLTVNNSTYRLRIQGQIVRGLQARLHLFTASPAFLNSEEHYNLAIKYAAELCSKQGFTLASDGVEFYNKDDDKNNPEILWRGSASQGSGLESSNFPYSLNGGGEINPTQNLVDAFYKSDGYPISINSSVNYNPQDPYVKRDPRLDKFIVYNGGKIGSKKITITSGQDDGVGKIINKSTRTGYYMKKLLRPDVVIPVSGSATTKEHFPVYMRYTELYLILAEAMNEIGGPAYTADGVSKSAKDIIRDIRRRALGITLDPYLESIVSKEEMRKLIQNERRLELCFEGFRFWDLRRNKLPLTETATGTINDGTTYSIMNVEPREMLGDQYYYMPLPYRDVLKYSLTQNKGW